MTPARRPEEPDAAVLPRYRIAEVSQLVGVSVSTIRLWEDHGLVRPDRGGGQQRRYSAADVNRLKQVQMLRSVRSLNLSAIRTIVDAGDRDGEALPGEIGGRLRAARLARGLTLRQVAQQTGLAMSSISSLERTSRGASMSAFGRLARCYQLELGELMGPSSNCLEGAVRAGTGRRVPYLLPQIDIEQLSVGQVGLDCEKWILLPGAASDGAYVHAGQEFVYVLQGQFDLTLDSDTSIRLGPHDSICFASTRPHSWRNAGQTPAVVIWINAPALSGK